MEAEEIRFKEDNFEHLPTDLKVMDVMPYSLVYWNGTYLNEKRPSIPTKKKISNEEKWKIILEQKLYDERGKLLNLMDDDQGYYTYKQSKFSLIQLVIPETNVFRKQKLKKNHQDHIQQTN